MVNFAQNFGAFVPTTNIWDPSQLDGIEGLTPALRELLVRMYQNINTLALVLNAKDSAIYNTDEFVNGQLFYPDPTLSSSTSTVATFRNVYRMVVNFGALPNAGLKSVLHNIPITSGFTFTRIYGAASDTTGLTYLPLPYVDAAATDNIQLDVDQFDVNITTTSDRTNYTVTYIILEYLKF
jgi:hypothetical protein